VVIVALKDHLNSIRATMLTLLADIYDHPDILASERKLIEKEIALLELRVIAAARTLALIDGRVNSSVSPNRR
jgi:hypothetical protein